MNRWHLKMGGARKTQDEPNGIISRSFMGAHPGLFSGVEKLNGKNMFFSHRPPGSLTASLPLKS